MEPTAPASGAEYGYREFVRDTHKVLRTLKEKSSKTNPEALRCPRQPPS